VSEDFLPGDVIEAAVSAIGKVFYYKSSLKALLRRCGVSAAWFDRYAHETKYVIARNVFGDLELRGKDGREVALRIVQELCAIRKPPTDNVDVQAAKVALDELRSLASSALLENAKQILQREKRQLDDKQRVADISLRERKLQACHENFIKLLKEPDTQKTRLRPGGSTEGPVSSERYGIYAVVPWRARAD
jgi:hypothetical protein